MSLLLLRDLAVLVLLLFAFIVTFGLMAATQRPASKVRRPK